MTTTADNPRTKLRELLEKRFNTVVPAVSSILWIGPSDGVVDVYFNIRGKNTAVVRVPEFPEGTSVNEGAVLEEIAASDDWDSQRTKIGF